MFSTIVDPAELHSSAGKGIVYIGDSIHPDPIIGGNGANHAIKDAIDLAEHIAYKGTSKESIKDFYDRKWDGWRESNERAEAILAKMLDPRSKANIRMNNHPVHS